MSAAQRGIRVAFQGEPGAFSEDAITQLWPDAAITLVPARDCMSAAVAVRDELADFAVLAIENTIAGSVSEAYDALCATSDLEVVGETVVPIGQCLLAPEGATLDSLRAVYSHRIALGQCRRFLSEHSHLAPTVAFDTAGAARDVAERGNTSEAAIAGRAAARRYGLSIVRADIQDRADNATRFWAVRRASCVSAPGAERVVLRSDPLTTPHTALRSLARELGASGMEMTHIETRPAGEAWSRYYIVEAIAILRGETRSAIDAAALHRSGFTLLGALPIC